MLRSHLQADCDISLHCGVLLPAAMPWTQPPQARAHKRNFLWRHSIGAFGISINIFHGYLRRSRAARSCWPLLAAVGSRPGACSMALLDALSDMATLGESAVAWQKRGSRSIH
eukprot:4428388-Pleurochrysis_carterae.AAC.1